MSNQIEPRKSNRKNIIINGICFLFIFSGYRSNQDIAQRVLKSYEIETENSTNPFTGVDGYKANSLVYLAFAIFTWITPIIVDYFQPKKSMIIGGLTYAAILACHIYPDNLVLILMSIVNGAGSAILWTAQGAFVVLNSSEKDVIKNSAIFWTIFQMSYFFGNFYIYFAWSGVEQISSDQRIPLYIIFAGLAIVGCFGLLLTEEKSVEKDENIKFSDIWAKVGQSFQMLKSKHMLLACITFGYTGFHFCFQAMIYATCIAETVTFGKDTDKLMGMNGIVTGLGQISAGLILSTTKILKSHQVILLSLAATICGITMIFYNFGSDCKNGQTFSKDSESIYLLSLVPAFLLGFSYSGINTQIYTFIRKYYPETPAPGFAIFKFIQSIFVASGFYWFSGLRLDSQCGLMFVFVVISCLSFYRLLKD